MRVVISVACLALCARTARADDAIADGYYTMFAVAPAVALDVGLFLGFGIATARGHHGEEYGMWEAGLNSAAAAISTKVSGRGSHPALLVASLLDTGLAAHGYFTIGEARGWSPAASGLIAGLSATLTLLPPLRTSSSRAWRYLGEGAEASLAVGFGAFAAVEATRGRYGEAALSVAAGALTGTLAVRLHLGAVAPTPVGQDGYGLALAGTF